MFVYADTVQSAKIAVLVQKAGFPPGVINVITGFGNVSGSILSHHMDVRALSFTGSGRTGELMVYKMHI